MRTYPITTAMFLFHGCCVEGPLAAIEGLLRFPLYLLGGLLLLLLSPCARDRGAAAAQAGCVESGRTRDTIVCATAAPTPPLIYPHRPTATHTHTRHPTLHCSALYKHRRWLRESALFAAAGLTLLIPGMALFAYRGFSPVSEEWDVAREWCLPFVVVCAFWGGIPKRKGKHPTTGKQATPSTPPSFSCDQTRTHGSLPQNTHTHTAIPTFLGAVDPRRFYVFSFGQASVAGNAYYDADIGPYVCVRCLSCVCEMALHGRRADDG